MMAKSVSVSLKFTDNISETLSKAPGNVKSAAMSILEVEAQRLEEYMKINRPWTDRTGNARAGLKAEVQNTNGDNVSIVLSHSVYYGVYLEYAMERRFAIINPTIQSQGHRVTQAFEGEIRRLLG